MCVCDSLHSAYLGFSLQTANWRCLTGRTFRLSLVSYDVSAFNDEYDLIKDNEA